MKSTTGRDSEIPAVKRRNGAEARNPQGLRGSLAHPEILASTFGQFLFFYTHIYSVFTDTNPPHFAGRENNISHKSLLDYSHYYLHKLKKQIFAEKKTTVIEKTTEISGAIFWVLFFLCQASMGKWDGDEKFSQGQLAGESFL